MLNKACRRIGEACKSRGIVGYFAVDFVTFIHPKTVSSTIVIKICVLVFDMNIWTDNRCAVTRLILQKALLLSKGNFFIGLVATIVEKVQLRKLEDLW